MNHALRPTVVLALCSALAALTAASTATAAGIPARIRGVIPVHGAHLLRGSAPTRGAPSRGASSPINQTAAGALGYHGGPVMNTNRTHAIFWGPLGSFPPNYVANVDAYLANVAAASGAIDNVYGIAPEYSLNNEPLRYFSTFAPTFPPDPAAYPTNCVDPSPTPTTACVTDADLQTEIATYIDSHGLSTGLGDVYFVFTPPGVGSCTDVNPSHGCAYRQPPGGQGYCAYHSDFVHKGAEVIYANIPFDDVSECSSGQYPNGTPSGPGSGVDPTLDGLSHEHNEAITDPLFNPGAWYDNSSGDENGDKCAQSYGNSQGSTASGQYNQTINGGHYYIQQEWSNLGAGCLSHDESPTAGFAHGPTTPAPGQTTVFDGTSSNDGDGTLSYSWSFGDGAAGSGAQLTHTYAAPGNYTVSLTVTDPGGQTASTRQVVAVAVVLPGPPPPTAPPAPPPPPVALGGTVTIPPQRLKQVLRRGLLVDYTTTRAASARLSVLAGRRVARRLRLSAGRRSKQVRLGVFEGPADATRPAETRVKFDAAVRKRLRRASRLAFDVQLVLTDSTGRAVTVVQHVALRR